MITTAIILGVGSLVGGALGWKLGRTYERVRGGKKADASEKSRGHKDRASR